MIRPVTLTHTTKFEFTSYLDESAMSSPEPLQVLRTCGHEQYGSEPVSQLEHALQCATLASHANASKSLVVACLLHDVGHLIHNLGEDIAAKGLDDRHECRAVLYLAPKFPAAITEPIRLHVDAKRYLCAVNPDYWQSLSFASKRSLELQGGIFSPQEASRFIQRPYAKDAVQLRIWDDQAKVPGQQTLNLNDFQPVLKQVVVQG